MTFASLFLNYFLYINTIMYNLIPIFVQTVFLYLFNRKNIIKNIITIFLTQGIVLTLAQFIHDILYSLYRYPKNIGLLNTINSENFKIDVLVGLIIFIILIIITFLISLKEASEKRYLKFIINIISYLLNLVVLLFLMFRFNTLFKL